MPALHELPSFMSYFGFTQESTFATPLAATFWNPMTSCSMEPDPQVFYPPVMQGRRDAQIYALYGASKAVGDFTAPFFPSSAHLLKSAIGTESATTPVGSGGRYIHTFSQADVLDSLTFEKNIGGYQSEQYAGGRITKFNLSCPTSNAPVGMVVGVESKLPIVVTPSTPSWVFDTPFVFAEGTVTLYNGVIATVTDLTFSLDNGVKSVHTIQNVGHSPSFITPQHIKVSGTMKVVFQSLDDATVGYFNKALPPSAANGYGPSGIQGALSFTFAHPASAGGDSITIDVPQINLSKYADTLNIGDLVVTDLGWEASYSQSSGYTVQAQVTNSHSASY